MKLNYGAIERWFVLNFYYKEIETVSEMLTLCEEEVKRSVFRWNF